MFNLSKISKYLENPSLQDSVFVDDESTIHFHWSNHRITKKIAQQTVNLKSTQVSESLWIKNDDSYLKFCKKEITNYIASKNIKDDNLFDIKSIARCLSEEFEDSCIADHINVSDLQSAYYRMSLKNKVPQRNFRLSTLDEILMCYSNDFLYETKIVIHQFSNSGILFKSTSEEFFEIFEDNNEFKIYLDSYSLTNKGKAYSESEENAIVLRKENIKLCDQLIDECSYFYVRYTDMNSHVVKQNLCNYLDLFQKDIIKKIA